MCVREGGGHEWGLLLGAGGSQLQMKDKTQDDDNDDDVWLFLGGIHFEPGCALEAHLILFDKLRGRG